MIYSTLTSRIFSQFFISHHYTFFPLFPLFFCLFVDLGTTGMMLLTAVVMKMLTCRYCVRVGYSGWLGVNQENVLLSRLHHCEDGDKPCLLSKVDPVSESTSEVVGKSWPGLIGWPWKSYHHSSSYICSLASEVNQSCPLLSFFCLNVCFSFSFWVSSSQLQLIWLHHYSTHTQASTIGAYQLRQRRYSLSTVYLWFNAEPVDREREWTRQSFIVCIWTQWDIGSKGNQKCLTHLFIICSISSQ